MPRTFKFTKHFFANLSLTQVVKMVLKIDDVIGNEEDF